MQWCTSCMWQPLQGWSWGCQHPGLLRLGYQGSLAWLHALLTGQRQGAAQSLLGSGSVVCWSCFHSSWCYLLLPQPCQSSSFICTAGRLPGQGTGIFLAQLRGLSSDDKIPLPQPGGDCLVLPQPGITGATWDLGVLVDGVSSRAGTGGALVVER